MITLRGYPIPLKIAEVSSVENPRVGVVLGGPLVDPLMSPSKPLKKRPLSLTKQLKKETGTGLALCL